MLSDMAKVGRPTGYKEEFIQKVDEYLKNNQDEYYEFHKTRGEKSDSFERHIKVNLPSREGFASYIGFSHDALSDWEKNFVEFGVALRKIDEEQKRRLISCGLSGDYNPLISKLVLAANHGMIDKEEKKLSGMVGLSRLYDEAEATKE